MASYFLPSFLTGWELPSISAYSLSSALQRRVFSFLLKRTLGHLVKGGQLDLDQIDAGIGSGKVEIRNVLLDCEAINRLLPTLPIQLVTGRLGTVAIQLPLPNLWSGELSLTVSDVYIKARLTDDAELLIGTAGLHETLVASFASAASEIFERDQEGVALEESIHQSLIEENIDVSSEIEAGSIISGHVEGLLARLKVSLQHLHIDVETVSRFSLKVSQVSLETEYRDTQPAEANSADTDSPPTSPASSKFSISETIRTVTIENVDILQTDDDASADTSSGTSDSSSDSDEEQPSISRPYSVSASTMSQSAASLYESAIDDDSEPASLRSASTTLPLQRDLDDAKIFGAGQEAIVVTVTTRKDKEHLPEKERQRLIRVVKLSTIVDVAVGHLSLILQPSQICSLIKAAARIGSLVNRPSQAERVTPSPRPGKPLHFSLDLSIRSVNMICAYEVDRLSSASDQRKAIESIRAFWQRPQRCHPELGHIRLKVDAINAAYTTASTPINHAPSLSLTVADLGVYEHLPAALVAGESEELPRTLPILILDHNLAHSGEPSTPSGRSRHRGQNSEPTDRLRLDGLGLDAIDWRVAPHAALAASAPGAARTAHFNISEDRRPSPSSLYSPYVKTVYGERGWKVRSKHRSTPSFSSDSGEHMLHSIQVTVPLPSKTNGQQISVTTTPVHLFLDLSLVTRILPMLHLVANAARESTEEALAADLGSSVATISSHSVQMERDLLVDLEDTDNNALASSMHITTEVIRIELRVPQSAFKSQSGNSRKSLQKRRSLGLETRSGVLILEVRSLQAWLGDVKEAKKVRGVQFANLHEPVRSMDKAIAKVSFARITAFHKSAKDGKTHSFACISSIDDPESDSFGQIEPPLPPCLRILQARKTSKKHVDCRLPSVHVSLEKEMIDSLQFVADDLTQWVAIWGSETFGDSESMDNEGLRILGSRFFGTRAGMSVMSSSTDSTATLRDGSNSSAVSLSISEAVIRLRMSGEAAPSPAQSSHRDVLVAGSEINVRLETDRAPNTTLIIASILTFSVESSDLGAGGDETKTKNSILARTMEPGLTRAARPMVAVKIESFSEPGTSYRESNIEVSLACITASPPTDSEFLDEIKAFLKAPEGVFEQIEPNEVTRISLKARDCSVLLVTPAHDARAALALGEVSVKTKLTSHAPKAAFKLALADVNVFMIERFAESSAILGRQARTAAEYWNLLGFARLLAMSELKASVGLNSLTRPDVDVKVTKVRAKVYACADTLGVMGEFIGAFSNSSSKKPNTDDDAEVASSKGTNESGSPFRSTRFGLDSKADLLASVEEDVFRRAPPMASVADLVEDDVPTNPTFLGETHRYHPDIVESVLDNAEFFGGGSVASLSINPATQGNVLCSDGDVTIRLLDPRGIKPVPEYFTDPELKPRSRSIFESSASSIRVRVTNLDFALRLHGGYDWLSTRQVVEEEARRVKRRLQKIKQLLAEGQTPDDSVEAAMSNLMDSIHISLPQDASEMDPAAVIRAVDEGLGENSETASNSDAGTWQPLPRLAGGASATGSDTRRRNKLERSRKSMIDFNFKGLDVEFDLLDPIEPHFASRVSVTAESFDIIDNIKTSTWHAFLTRMKVKEAAYRRNTEARMIRVELLNLRSKHGAEGDQEVRVRAKIEPLRLHVDQDALDFLKKFFAFKPPGHVEAAPDPNAAASATPFIQYAEVYPVKLKLDYKPKRVDYNLLREGKTIELMNFFHFEAAEMTLRHITLRGINGWPRLFDTLNDIWTPDVKANQLADVLSGVAPIRSLVNVGAGVADLVLLPIEQYQKDKRIIRGVQKGATSFAKTTALEAVRLGARLAIGTQVILEQAEHILGGRMNQPLRGEAVAIPDRGDLTASDLFEEQISRYADQPEDMKEALSQAYEGLSRGFTSAAQTILAVPMEVYEGGSSGSSRPVVKAVPIAVLRGARGATQALTKTMQGIQAHLGDHNSTDEGKYKRSQR